MSKTIEFLNEFLGTFLNTELIKFACVASCLLGLSQLSTLHRARWLPSPQPGNQMISNINFSEWSESLTLLNSQRSSIRHSGITNSAVVMAGQGAGADAQRAALVPNVPAGGDPQAGRTSLLIRLLKHSKHFKAS